MKILLLIDNNLKNDSRVMRHINLMLDCGAEVEVVALPIPDNTCSLSREGLNVDFFPSPPITIDPVVIRKLAEKLGVWHLLWRAWPGISTHHEYAPLMKKHYSKIQEKQLSLDHWKDFRASIAKKDVKDYEEHQGLNYTFEFFLKWAEYTLNFPADIVYCNDLRTLICGVAHKRKFRSRLVYDAHEIFCDIVPGYHSRVWKDSMALYEHSLIRNADSVIGVSESHVAWMGKTHGVWEKVRSIPNCPVRDKSLSLSEKKFSLPLRIYYHGASDRSRNILHIIKAVNQFPDLELVMRCVESDHLQELKEFVCNSNISNNVHFLELVPSSRIVAASHDDGDIGIVLCDIQPCLNSSVGLANKFIEYMMAGLPIITCPIKEQVRVVEEYGIGYVLKDNTVESVKKAFEFMLSHRDRLAEMSVNSYKAGITLFDWEAYSDKLWKAITG
ncbi:MAG: glycosyltransferase [Vulcanimicrobiota bacterium]